MLKSSKEILEHVEWLIEMSSQAVKISFELNDINSTEHKVCINILNSYVRLREFILNEYVDSNRTL